MNRSAGICPRGLSGAVFARQKENTHTHTNSVEKFTKMGFNAVLPKIKIKVMKARQGENVLIFTEQTSGCVLNLYI